MLASPSTRSSRTRVLDDGEGKGAARPPGAVVPRLLRRAFYGRFTGNAWRASWSDLDRELNLWRKHAWTARFWWRDDDATADTPALQRLLGLRDQLDLPLALAVVPASLDASLVAALSRQSAVAVLQHGWTHTNHAGGHRYKSEFPVERRDDEVARELRAGRDNLCTAFGLSAMPVLVPPFNHLAPRWVPYVSQCGLRYVSIDQDFTGLAVDTRNVHVDVIDWQKNTARDLNAILGRTVLALRLRRWGLVPLDTPIGIMTHHLDHDEAVWAVTHRLLSHLSGHPAVRFPPLDEIFAP